MLYFYFSIIPGPSTRGPVSRDSARLGHGSLILFSIGGLFISSEIVYEYAKKNSSVARYIEIREYNRPHSPHRLDVERTTIGEIVNIVTYTQRVAVAASIVLIVPPFEGMDLFFLLVGANVLILSTVIVSVFLFSVNSLSKLLIPDEPRKKAPELSLDRFHEKMENRISLWIDRNSENKGTARSVQELLEHNEDNNLEFKASMWTKYKTVNKISTEES